MATAFQSNAFQNNAFQIEVAAGEAPAPAPASAAGGATGPASGRRKRRPDQLVQPKRARSEPTKPKKLVAERQHPPQPAVDAFYLRDLEAKARAREEAAKEAADPSRKGVVIALSDARRSALATIKDAQAAELKRQADINAAIEAEALAKAQQEEDDLIAILLLAA
jgi:hypothetical protein